MSALCSRIRHSDLLSRHVNKCHSTEKKPGPPLNNSRKKPRQLSTSSATQQPGPQYQQPSQIDTNISPDPFSNAHQQSPRRDSGTQSLEAADPPSFSSSSLASNSSASASVDSLPPSATEPVFHLPQQHFNSQAGFQRQWGSNPYPYLQSFNGNIVSDSSRLFEPKLDPTFSQPANQYNDLPTPMAYPAGSYRPNPSETSNSLDPFIPNQFSSMQPFSGVPGDSTAYMPSLPPSQPAADSQQTNGFTRGETFSSAFGLMTLDDPSVLAGISADGAPFFDSTGAGTNGVTDLQAFLSQNNNLNFLPTDGNNAQTPNTRERENNAMRDMWSTFLKDPTTGLKADGTEMGKPEFPAPSHPPLHRRSSSYSGSGSPNKPTMQSTGQNAPHVQHPAGDLKTIAIPQSLQGNQTVVQRLEDQVSKLEAVAIPSSTVLSSGPEALKSYEEAIQSRKAPMLKLPTKMKSRDGTGIPGSSILPSSQAGRTPMVGGGVASLYALQQQQLPTAAGASSVPVGSTPNTAFQQHIQQFGPDGRPIIAMPKPRSRRPSNATTGPTSRPSSSTSGIIPGAIPGLPPNNSSNYGSRPSSRPGTASSAGGGFANQNPSAHASPPTISHTHSQPNSRPSTAAGMSPSQSFAYAPPGAQYGMSPTGVAYNMQPGSLPTDSAVSPIHQSFSALSSAAMDGNATSTGRPNYKRLASQTLEPTSAKRPHFRRGDTNFNPTPDDGFDSEGGSDAGSIHSERSYSGHEHAYSSAGPGAYGRLWGSGSMNGFGASARRMSEPAVAAPRMMMRMPTVAKP